MIWRDMKGKLRPWLASPRLWLVTIPLTAITLLHYLTPASHTFHMVHGILRRLYYVPILSAALLSGFRGGIVTALIVSILYLPHVVYRWQEIPSQTWEALFEIVLYNALGGLIGWLAESVRSQREALVRSDQLKGLGQMAAGMAHEVRNPLASISASAARLRKGGLADGVRNELLGIVEKESTRLDSVVRDFLGYARPARLVITSCDMNTVVAETVALATHTASERSIMVLLEADASAGPVAGDPSRLKQALLNLMLNAVQAAPGGSEVIVKTLRSRKEITVIVRDSGAGIDPEIRGRLFEPFATTKPDGLGLGLSIARQIVEAHGGKLALEDAPGGGTVARVTLPEEGK